MLEKKEMDTLKDSLMEFIKVRQLNIAVLILLTVLYAAYQYRAVLFKPKCNEPELRRCPSRNISRSNSRSRSRQRSPNQREYKSVDPKHSRRGRNAKRCPDCNKYN